MGKKWALNNSTCLGLALLIAIVILCVDRKVTVLAAKQCPNGWDYDAVSKNCFLDIYQTYLKEFLHGDGTNAGSKCFASMKLDDTRNVRFNCSSKHQLLCQRKPFGARVFRLKLEAGNYSIRVSSKN